MALLLPALILCSAPARVEPWADFRVALRSFVTGDSVVGAAAVFVRDGRVMAREAIGLSDRGRREPVDSNTIFHWGSITKTLTAVAIMQLRDRKLLSLDDPVTRWVPELRQVHDSFGAIDRITVRMLLSHSGGFQSPTWPYGEGRPWEPFEPTRWDQLVAMMPYQQVLFEPGTHYHYSNPAFIYLARIIESVTGDPWISYIQKNVWTPLGMSQSYVNATPWHVAAHRANSYTLLRDSAGRVSVRENGREFDPGITIPNGGWNAPMADLVTWAAFLTGAVRPEAAQARGWSGVLSPASLQEMWRPVVPVGDGSAMGLSFFILPGEPRLLFHTGEQSGFRSLLMFDPVSRRAVIVSVNTVNYADSASDTRWTALLQAAAALLRSAP